MDISEVRSPQLFTMYCEILHLLKERGLIRSTNNPVADYAERLVSTALSLSLAPKSTTGYDAVDTEGRKYEIKGRRVTHLNKSRQLSAIRGLSHCHFDFLAGVLFREDFTVLKACLIPHSSVHQFGKFREHVNATIVHLRDSVWDDPEVVDITEAVKAAQAECTSQ
ncbi:hypothetical protein [Citrifermentans bremense]|uniref:Restriction endonuclease n=1 Tax=Citrifermentans bremense TaxID=60035 RepID=A0A6S6M463_9BACT|nr:hypothetical protein [Citrifermentans bremense]